MKERLPRGTKQFVEVMKSLEREGKGHIHVTLKSEQKPFICLLDMGRAQYARRKHVNWELKMRGDVRYQDQPLEIEDGITRILMKAWELDETVNDRKALIARYYGAREELIELTCDLHLYFGELPQELNMD